MPHGLELLLFVLLAGTLGMIPAVLMALWIADKVATRRALRASLPVDAVVLSKRVIERTDAHEFTHYFPHVEYIFSVNGTEYTSSTIWSGGVSEFEMSINQVENFLQEFLTGQRVQTFYDLDDPVSHFGGFMIDSHLRPTTHAQRHAGGFADGKKPPPIVHGDDAKPAGQYGSS